MPLVSDIQIVELISLGFQHRNPLSPAVALLEETIKQYQRDSSLQNIIMTNAEDRDRIFNHLFSRALREVREQQGP